MESTKKGMPLDTPNLSNYRLTGEVYRQFKDTKIIHLLTLY